MKKINELFLYLLFFFSLVAISFAQPMREFNGEQRYVYDVSYKEMPVGKMIREFQHNGEVLTANTTADLSFLFYHFGGNQLSHIYWDEVSQLFLSKRFIRRSVGFERINTQVDFLKSGHQTSVIRDGKPYKVFNEKEKIVDFNTIGIQMSEGLKVGQTYFEFYMQTSDKVKHYFFEVTGKEVLQTKFGKLDTYRLQQIRKKDRTLIIWFAPEINYQMVKFIYKYNLLDLRGILTDYSSSRL